ncbi:LacI family DNA-binding transcriptional regulator [Agreia sp. COWG]|uniref:LacI family DNA-binding transcriptional regulator n=1 Tax=Agreia sp. COWG TaxID=2773266 RepID=UPI00192583A4|nr:LacI family DNA-binding transcriptional regulator [Agreia sp. COWG]CAD6010625.1 Ribose operon repressor [Agreia sp. COWG]
MSTAKSVTLGDVASVAGVSLSTASRALNGGGRISEDTRRRVKEASDRLGFQPNALARSFALGRSQTIGVLTQNASGVFTAPVLIGATMELGRMNQALLIRDARFDAATLNENVARLQARRIDGVVLIGDGLNYSLPSVTSLFRVPVAYAFGLTSESDDASFNPDAEMAGRLAATHLLETRRRRIAHITAGLDDPASRGRAHGFGRALAEAGLEQVGGKPLSGGWTFEWGVEATTRLLASGTEVDAIFCGNDQIALGAESAIRAAGLSVPRDVALIGVDNWEGMITSDSARLTTIDPCLQDVGAAAARSLGADEAWSPGAHLVPCRLIVRSTT